MARKKKTEDNTLEALEAATDAAEAHDKRPKKYLSLGCPLLNLAVSGDWRKGLIAGTYTFYVGDSQSGKTLATLSQLAEAANDPAFDDYELWHVNAEVGAFFDFEKFFGKKAAARIQTLEAPEGKVLLLEAVYDWIEKKLDAGAKLVVIVDSMDALSTEQLEAYVKACAKAREDGKDPPGSFGDGKAKINSLYLKRIISKIDASQSIVTSISQVRDNVGGGPYEVKRIRSGGHAMKFGGSLEIWTTPGQKITKDVNGSKRIVGMLPNFTVKKNRVNGRERTVTIPILPDVGMDAVGAAVDYLIAEKAWTNTNGRINCAPFYEEKYTREVLIRKIEDDNKEVELYDTMQACWDDIETKLTVTRKPRWS
jgi:recA bacterial DNA recombination protein